MPVESEWQLYDFSPVGEGLRSAVAASASSPSQPVQVQFNFPRDTQNTPRVGVTFTVTGTRDHKHIVTPFTRTQMQADDTYDFTLSCDVSCQREQNGALMNELVGRTRLALQLYKLYQFGQANLGKWPYHTIIEIRELLPSQLSTNDDNTADTTTLNFAGFFCIDAQAWPVVTPEPVVADLIVAGAGTDEVNGEYFEDGEAGGKPKYSKSPEVYIFWSTDDLQWHIVATGLPNAYFSGDDTSFPWEAEFSAAEGDTPPPTVSQL